MAHYGEGEEEIEVLRCGVAEKKWSEDHFFRYFATPPLHHSDVDFSPKSAKVSPAIRH